nr:aquaporin [Streptomyces sp. SID2888]
MQLLIIGGGVGLLLAALIISPPGRISGGHINPAISLAMWRFGVFPGAAVTPYAVAQLVGSLLGVLAARALWGPVTGRPPVTHAALQPATGWTAAELFVVEAVSMGVIVYLVGFFLQSPRLAPLVPWLVGLLIGGAIAGLGTTSGGSDNPASQFGPAVVSGRLGFLWVYLVAHMAGAVLAALVLQQVRTCREVLTHRLCGTRADRSALTAEDTPTLGRSRVRTGPAGSERTSPCPAGAAAPACPGTDEGPAPAGVPGQVRKP